MIFSDPSGDDTIHPVSQLNFPVLIPPPTRAEVVHRTLNSVISYKKPQQHRQFSKTLQKPLDIDHYYYQVKEMLDDGTTSSIEKFGTAEKLQKTGPETQDPLKKPVSNKPTRFLDDGSAYLRQEIVSSEDRVKGIKAGKALNFFFPERTKRFIEPNKALYNRQRLGTPPTDTNSKELNFYCRKRQVSLMNSSPNRPFIVLPSLKNILLHSQQNKEGIFEAGTSLNQKFEKLEKNMSKSKRADKRLAPSLHEKNLIKIVKNHLKVDGAKESLEEDPVSHLMERFKEFEDGKEKLKGKLKEILATQKFDRPEAIWLKYKHFKPSERASVYQGKMLDIWNMRMEAEKERVESYRGMINQICWYRDLLWFTIEKCQDINPYTYYILDYIKALTEECIVVDKETMRRVVDTIPQNEISKGNSILISKILSDLSSPIPIFNQ